MNNFKDLFKAFGIAGLFSWFTTIISILTTDTPSNLIWFLPITFTVISVVCGIIYLILWLINRR